jgi:hypothetical protein
VRRGTEREREREHSRIILGFGGWNDVEFNIGRAAMEITLR